MCVLDMYRSGMGMMDRDFGRSDMGMNRPFGDSFGGLGKCVNISRCTHTCCVCVVMFFFSIRWRNGRIWRWNGELWHGPNGLRIRYTHKHRVAVIMLYFISGADCSLVCELLISLCMLYPSHKELHH